MTVNIAWDDLQYFLAVCRRRSIGGAAKWLGVNHSTVLRRIASLEQSLSLRLFDRLAAGYALTAHGRELAAGLAGLEEQVETATRRLTGGDHSVQGVIRVTSTDTLIHGLLMPHVARFRGQHPGVQIQLVVNNSFLSLTQREADIAVRGTNRPPDNLIGRRVGAVETALYASREHAKAARRARERRWVALDESLAHVEAAKWLRRNVAPEHVVMRVDSLVAHVDAVAAGIGVGLLLSALADQRPGLVRLEAPLPELDTDVWILTHPDLKDVARIRALTDSLYVGLSADPLLKHARPR